MKILGNIWRTVDPEERPAAHHCGYRSSWAASQIKQDGSHFSSFEVKVKGHTKLLFQTSKNAAALFTKLRETSSTLL